jgi:hypothetical protein
VRLLALLFLPLLCGACSLAMTHGPAVYETCSADPALWTLSRAQPADAAKMVEDWGIRHHHVPDAHYRHYWFDGVDGQLMHCFGAFSGGRPNLCRSSNMVRARDGAVFIGALTNCET